MKNGGKKKIIIGAIIIILIIVLLVGGIFAYLTTDLFKSDQTLFFKYMGKALENLEYVENTRMTEISNKKEQNPYTIVGNLKFEKGEEVNDINASILSNMDLQINAKVNKIEDKTYAKANLNYQNENLFSLEYAKSNNIYALKSDEIITAFLGIENSNLKVLAQKLGIYDTKIIPDNIKEVNINNLLSISNEEKEHIKETYLPVLIDVISQNNFKKEKNIEIQKEDTNYITTAYNLSLNKEELKQVKIAILQTLKEDSITLNLIATKAKLLGLDENYTQINNLTNTIQGKINTVNNEHLGNDAGLNITIYVKDNEIIKTEIISRYGIKYEIYSDVKENVISRYLLIEEENNKTEIKLEETRNDSKTNYNILIKIKDNIEINTNITNTGVVDDEAINTNCEVVISRLGNIISTINYEQEINFEDQTENIIELNTNNCGVLNSYTTEQLQVLLQSISQRIEIILNEKMQKIGWKKEISIIDAVTSANENENLVIKQSSNANGRNEDNNESNTIMVNEVNVTNEISSISNDVNEQTIINEIPNSRTNRTEAREF